ncbi:hypothetical protein AB0K12_29520 [Nonomuraea sp. NPDC049419]|uniref:hypothetical protein n=1 Tax=Nonomuraea sp. NPDC049419 TaxID=3155772 RepID=UPI00343B6CB7
MVKRLLVAMAVASSTLVISSPVSSQAATVTDTNCTVAGQSAAPGNAAVKCRWKTVYGDWCKQCYRHGKWRTEFCKDADEVEDD